MAILFDWYENPKTSEQQGEENMLHPRLRLNGKVSTAQLRARIQKYCTLTETDVIAVLEPVTEKTKRKNTKVRLKGIVYRPDRLLMDEVGKVKVQRTRFSFHSSKLTDEEIDALLTEFFTTHDFVQRKSFQLLCSMTQSTASRHLHRLCEEGKLKNVGLPKQPVYKPINGHYVVNE